ncbi:hypothetical protein BT69DRAFT_1346802 [Atractiella rhizophila]|nr:hypothetical protein BT69DRAFT_1346802 [Atractiella rhizophila]
MSLSSALVKQSRRQQDKLKKVVIKRAPPLIAAHWDVKKTPRQNFRALGLATGAQMEVNGVAGGVERSLEDTGVYALEKRREAGFEFDDLPIEEHEGSEAEGEEYGKMEKGKGREQQFGRIIRDEKTGEVLKIVIDGEEEEEEEKEEMTPWGKPFDSLPPPPPSTSTSHLPSESSSSNQTPFHDALTSLSRQAATQRQPRHSSLAEKEWLKELVDVHGDDYAAMERDKRRNRSLKTKGEIRRLILREGLAVGARRS